MSSTPAIDPKDFYIHHRKDETVVRLPGQINGLDLMLEELTNCTVYLLDYSAQITIDYCTNTHFIIGPIDGSLFIRNCNKCTVSVACRQLRTRECTDSDIYLYCATKSPIIESSSNLRFHQFNAAYPHLTEHFTKAKLDPQVNYWNVIYDFSANDTSIEQPHSIVVEEMPELQILQCYRNGEKIDGESETPIKIEYKGKKEVRVDAKTTTLATAASPPSTASEPAKMESFGSQSFGSQSSKVSAAPKQMESFGSQSQAASKSDAPAKKMESFGSSSISSTASAATAAASPVITKPSFYSSTPLDTPAAIRKQVEFYFSNSNLPRDEFLKKIYESDEGWIPVATLAPFKSMQKLTTDISVVIAALKESTFLKLNGDNTKVTRVTPLPSLEDIQATSMQSTIHVCNIPHDVSLDAIQAFFSQPKFGLTVNCIRMARDKQKQFCGTVLIELASEAEAKKAVENLHEKIKWHVDDEAAPTLQFYTREQFLQIKQEEVAKVDSPSSEPAPSTSEAAAAATSSSSSSTGTTSGVTPTETPDVTSKTVVKDASFSIHTSAEDATRALFELAGVTYVPTTAATTASKPIAAAASVTSPSNSPPPTAEQEEASLNKWLASNSSSSSSADSPPSELEQRVAAAESARVAALERRRQEAEAKAAELKRATADGLKEFYTQRQVEQDARKASQANRSSASELTAASAAASASSSSSSAAAADPAFNMSSLLSSLSASSTSSSSSSSASSVSSLDASWNEVVSMLSPALITRNNGSDLLRMKMMYLQLKQAKEKQRAAEEEEAKKLRRKERKRKKKEKKKAKKQKKKEAKRAALAAAGTSSSASTDGAALAAIPPYAYDSSCSSSSSSSSDSDDD